MKLGEQVFMRPYWLLYGELPSPERLKALADCVDVDKLKLVDDPEEVKKRLDDVRKELLRISLLVERFQCSKGVGYEKQMLDRFHQRWENRKKVSSGDGK